MIKIPSKVWKVLTVLTIDYSLKRICFYDPVEDLRESLSWFRELLERRIELREMYLLDLSFDLAECCDAFRP